MAQTLSWLPTGRRRDPRARPARRRATPAEAGRPGWRSEAFAEDLPGFEAPAPSRAAGRTRAVLLSLAPLCAALAGALLVVVTGGA